MPALTLRIAGLPEIESIRTVLAGAFEAYRPLYTPAAWAATVIDAAEVRRRLEEGPVWLALYQGETVGTASMLLREEGAYLRGMAVLPARQGLKIGLRLLQAAEAWAVAADSHRLFLYTTPFLQKAIRLYQQFGFVAPGPGLEDFFGTPVLLMEKPLSRAR